MFPIKTQRLDLVPLNNEQLLLLKTGRNELERSLGLGLTDFRINFPGFVQMFEEALEKQIIPMVRAHTKNYFWYTHWLIVDRTRNITVGGIGVWGPPDKNGETFIGYFAEAGAEGKGYTTEAVTGLTQWIFKHPGAQAIVADTLSDGFASQRVLQKAGFMLWGPCEDGLRWKLYRA